MITLEAQGPVKETELFVDLLCSFGFVKTYSQTYKNIEKTRALIVMEAGTPVSFFQNAPVDEHTDMKFVSEDMSHVRLHRNSTVAACCTCPACD